MAAVRLEPGGKLSVNEIGYVREPDENAVKIISRYGATCTGFFIVGCGISIYNHRTCEIFRESK